MERRWTHRLARILRPNVAWLPPLAYLAFAIVVTWPWIIDPSTTLLGPIGGDVSSSIAKFGALADSGAVPFISGHITTVGFPDGVATTPGIDGVSFFSASYLWIGSVLFGPVAAHGLLGLLGYFLTATVTYLFVRRVTGSVGAGLVAGVAYGFAPHLYAVVWAATTYAHMWLLLLPMWAFWNLAQSPSRRTALLAGASLIPAMFWTPYFALHAFTVCVACLSVLAALGPRIGLERRLLAFVVAPWAPALVVYVGIGLLTSFSDAPDRPLTDFYEQSAHPVMFVWPGYASIWGDGASTALADIVPRARSANLYVGLSVLVLAAIGCWSSLRPWIATHMRARPSPVTVAGLLALATVVACLACSLPPRVLHGTVPTPASLIYEVVPALRAGQRFVMPLMAGTSVLAGLGTAAVLRRVPRTSVVPVALALAVIVGVDLYTHPSGIPAEVPPRSPALTALAKAPDGPVIHILATGWLGGASQRACLLQEVHHKTLVNTCTFGKASPRLQRLGLEPICTAIAALHKQGLRYVLTEPSPPPNVAACFTKDSPIGKWRLMARDKYMWIHELGRPGA